MKREPDWETIACREAIRAAGFELADSGLFDDWYGVWRALHARFTADQLRLVFDSPFSRLDLNQRCDGAKGRGGACSSPRTATAPAFAHDEPPHQEKIHRTATRSRPQACETLLNQLLKTLDDGRPRTAMDLAQQLSVSQNEVLRAMRALLAENAVLVSGFVRVTHGGRRPRALVSIGAAGFHRQFEVRSSSARTRWPAADGVLHSAMEAIIRQDAPGASGSAAGH